MLVLLVGLSALTLVLLVVLLVKAGGQGQAASDPRMDAALAELQRTAEQMQRIGEQMTRVDARGEALERHVRESFLAMRGEMAEQAKSSRGELAASVAELRGSTERSLEASGERLTRFTAETSEKQGQLRDALNAKLMDMSREMNAKLQELMTSNAGLQEKLRGSMEERLTKLNTDNSAKLEEMRVTVDEKLHATLQTRLTESFGQVTDQLTKVHAGLGEMTKLSAGVDDLSRIFTNVKSRGQFAEAMLDNLLKQMLAPSQFVRNAQVKPNTLEAVEFAVRFPGPNGDVLLPIDSKFPRESWERLETAYETGGASDIAAARKVFEGAIRTQAKRICAKYINEPITTPNAVMFLPTESLYAEVMRLDGLHDEIQQNCHVMIAGPSNLSAILTSFQMVFALVNLQKKGGEVWQVLAGARTEFGKFEKLMDRVEGNVTTMQNTLKEIGTRTRVINKSLRDVESLEPGGKADNVLQFEDIPGVLPLLAAADEDE